MNTATHITGAFFTVLSLLSLVGCATQPTVPKNNQSQQSQHHSTQAQPTDQINRQPNQHSQPNQPSHHSHHNHSHQDREPQANAITNIWQGQSQYTSLKYDDCTTLAFIEEQEGYYHGRCPAIAPYQIEIEGGDLRYGINIIYNEANKNKKIQYWYSQFFNVGNTLEWRYHINDAGQKVYHGLIYRIYSVQFDEATSDFKKQDKQELFVVRLDKENSCILDKIPASADMNIKARELADTISATCSDTLNDGGVVSAFLGE